MYSIFVKWENVEFVNYYWATDEIRMKDNRTGITYTFLFDAEEEINTGETWNLIQDHVNHHLDMEVKYYFDGNGNKIIYTVEPTYIP